MRVRAIINLFWTDVWDMHSATESHDRVLGWLTDHKIKSKLLSKTITSFIQIQATSSPARACSNGVPCPSVKFVKLKGTGTAVSEYLTGSGAGAAIGTDVASGSAGALLNSDVLGDLERISARGPTGETAFEWARGPTGLALEADPSGTPLTSGGATGGLGGCPAGSGGGPCILILSNWAWSPGGAALNFALTVGRGCLADGRALGGGGGGNSWAIGWSARTDVETLKKNNYGSKIKTAVT